MGIEKVGIDIDKVGTLAMYPTKKAAVNQDDDNVKQSNLFQVLLYCDELPGSVSGLLHKSL